MILDLDHEASLDPGRVGAKAAWLAMARRVGLPVLPGLVVERSVSTRHMALGAATLASRGSGGARLAVSGEPLDIADDLVAGAARLGDHLVARSSTALEGSGEWSGAFTSYLDLAPSELPKAVAGCWASAFSVDALERQRSASIEPGSFTMAVLVQPALDPAAGGTALLDETGTVVVHGVKGSPAPLLQGWSGGHEARTSDAGWVGDDLIELVGVPALDEIALQLRKARESLGANQCEWALDGTIWFLQLADHKPPLDISGPDRRHVEADRGLVPVVRVVARVPGRLGEELILPWALAGLPHTEPVAVAPDPDLSLAARLRDELVSQVWDMPVGPALAAARECMVELRGPTPRQALGRIQDLLPPHPETAARLLALVEAIRAFMVERGVVRDTAAAWHLGLPQVEAVLAGPTAAPVSRFGVGRWEPFLASVTLALGDRRQGTPASPGFGAGIRSHVTHPESGHFPTRGIITSPQPIPNLAPLLWDAAGLVTATGSPAAHLFESARALGVPAVCGLELDEADQIVAVDGHAGVVATLSLNGDDDV